MPQIDPTLWLRLNIEAKHRGLDISELLQEALRQFLGLPFNRLSTKQRPSNLDRLAGTWTQEDVEEFNRNTEIFGKIDSDMWE